MSILILAEHRHGHLLEQTAKTVQAALKLHQEIDILVAGKNVAHIAKQASHLHGVRCVYIADNAVYEHFLAENFAKLILTLAKDYHYILAPASSNGKNILPRVAALLDVIQLSEVTDIIDENNFKRYCYAGNIIETITCFESIKVITIRTSSFDNAKSDGQARLQNLNLIIENENSKFVNFVAHQNDQFDLETAKIVVAGGRAFASKENFDGLLLPLAEKLHAAIGASRAAVDAGFAPNDWQVGQTGKVVAPQLYIAIGLSGAIQHLAGMKDSRIIVAINQDEDAPIMQIADISLKGDLFEVLPLLTAKL